MLGWNFSPKGYAGTDEAPIPPEPEAVPPDSGEVLRPDFAVWAEPLQNAPAAGSMPGGWQLLVRVCEPGEDFDRVGRGGRDQGKGNGGGSGNGSERGGLEASPHGRMERLLRHTGVPAGLLF